MVKRDSGLALKPSPGRTGGALLKISSGLLETLGWGDSTIVEAEVISGELVVRKSREMTRAIIVEQRPEDFVS